MCNIITEIFTVGEILDDLFPILFNIADSKSNLNFKEMKKNSKPHKKQKMLGNVFNKNLIWLDT